ncbi:MAG: hypothetical protein DI628_05770 [Blastochloris viridis]|uniref:Uncharacterized protein n=1 Tax=Blastochloris viridis TaxID=1079 RepID=A0A6N4RBI4_BLAVI|nr:MAG: hypothetical protein DI628_05770 [Blastochloris viridis]
MQETFDITPAQPNVYVTHLKDTFTSQKPKMFKLMCEHDTEMNATALSNMKAFSFLAITVGVILALLIDSDDVTIYNGLQALVVVILIGIAGWISSRSSNTRNLRLAITQSWIEGTIQAALPTLAKPAQLTESYERQYKLYQADVNRLTTVLHTKAEELARKGPLAQFPQEMERFITQNPDIEAYITACYTHAEILGVRAPVHA